MSRDGSAKLSLFVIGVALVVGFFTKRSLGGALANQQLDAAGIVPYAVRAGFEGDDLTIAVAVALAESAGKTDAYNPETAAGAPEGRGSYGLWQIYRNVHPEFNAWDLNDPEQNAQAAFSVYSGAGGSFRPWSTFKNSAYLQHMDSAQAAVDALGVG